MGVDASDVGMHCCSGEPECDPPLRNYLQPSGTAFQRCCKLDTFWPPQAERETLLRFSVVDFGASTLCLRVKDQTGETTFFKLFYTTAMDKVFNAFSSRKGVDKSALRFLVDGERIGTDATPRSLALRDQDQLDVVLEQTGD